MSRRPKQWWKAVCWVVLAVLVVLGHSGCTSQTGPPDHGRVDQVRDGDTVVLTDGRKVRYLGIDTPELSSTDPRQLELARQAKQANTQLVQGVQLRLEYDLERYDQYNRLLAYIYLPDGRMLNVELVRQGLAHVLLIPPNLRHRETLIAAQRQAIENRRGRWRELPPAQEAHYVANRKSWRFHRPACPGAKSMAPKNRLIFKTPLDAYREGFSPAKDCQP